MDPAIKSQIQYMVKRLLKLQEIPKPDDAADALAIAICHLNSLKFNSAAQIQPVRVQGAMQ